MADPVTTPSTAPHRSEWWLKLRAVIGREYTTRVQTRWFVMSTLLAPIMLALLLFLPLAVSQQSNPAASALYNVTVIDATTTGLGERVAQVLGGGKYADQPMPEVRVVSTTELLDAERRSIDEAKLERSSGYLLIDSQTVATGAAQYVGRHFDNDLDQLQIREAIRQGIIGLRLERAGMGPERIDSLTIVNPTVAAAPLYSRNDKGAGAKLLLAIFLAFLMYMSIILYSQSVLSSVVEEKTSRVAEVVISSVKPDILLAGKVLGVSAVGLTQQVLWLVISGLLVYARGILFPGLTASLGAAPGGGASAFLAVATTLPVTVVLTFVAFFLLGFVFFGSLFAGLGATVNAESDARQAAQPVFLLLVLSVIFIQPVAAAPDGTLARVLSLLPISSSIIMPLRMAATHVPPLEVVASLVILAITCVGVVWMSARIYRVGLLMYGKRPSLAQLGRWIVAP